MAWKTVLVRTIPDADTAFERMSDEVIDYMKTNYDDTGKRISFSLSSSDDLLVGTNTSIFKDEASKNEFFADSTIAAESTRRNTINAANGIIREITVDEEV
jgi:hypothetical protein|tara:strand:+ start:1174 stop:1476 length:303 start_codon:yes stop_codon:yes gene_type:complete